MPIYKSPISNLMTTDGAGCGTKVQCDSMPVCPSCGGLQSLCRPRWFAGQVLSEDDLNRLDRYIIEKNRLHNRYIHGWGVACGLEVTCTVCHREEDRGKVLVKPGYALSPCGNDIVVSKTEMVDVCDLINRCRPPVDDCFSPTVETDCKDRVEDWVLAICYNEQTSRDVLPLRTSAGCSEGKRTSGQCGCGSSQKTAATKSPVAHGANVSRAPQCEPTVVCEGYTFKAYKVPDVSESKKQKMSALIKRFVCCFVPFLEDLGSLPATDNKNNYEALRQWQLNLRETVRDFLMREGLYDCEAAEKLSGIDLPPLTHNEYLARWTTSTVSILSVVLLVVQKCLCAALLPPCPEPSLDDCVPIATVSIGRRPCRVTKVCNLSSRRFLLTWPNVHYWLSWTPIFGPETGASTPRTLRDLLIRICCSTLLTERFKAQAYDSFSVMNGKPSMLEAAKMMAPESAAKATKTVQTQKMQSVFASLLSGALSEHQNGADIGTLLLAAMGAPGADGKPLAPDVGLGNPGEFVLMNQLMAPMLQTMFPMFTGETAAGAASSSEIEDLRSQISELRKLVKKGK